MPARLVKIINPNGQVGWVADTYPGLEHLKLAPSERARAATDQGTPDPADLSGGQAVAADPEDIIIPADADGAADENEE